MRVSPLFAGLCCMLMSGVFANHLRGRSLHPEDKSESKSTQGYTDDFCMTDECFGPDPEFDGANMIGVVLGFAVTGLFMIFGIVVQIRDAIHRVDNCHADLAKDRRKLQEQGCDAKMMDQYDNEFIERENRKKLTKEEAEKERLDLMAKN